MCQYSIKKKVKTLMRSKNYRGMNYFRVKEIQNN